MSYKDLPNQIPIFPLSGVLLLPKGQLPLNIFESRYLAMIDNVLANGRYLGMVQLKGSKTESGTELSEIYNVGCVGRVTAFAEMDDGRYIITLSGLARFKVLKELEHKSLWRAVEVDYVTFGVNDEKNKAEDFLRKPFIEALEAYFLMHKIKGSWDTIENVDLENLIASVAMAVPFSAEEKQAILECQTLFEQGKMLQSLMEMAVHENPNGEIKVHH